MPHLLEGDVIDGDAHLHDAIRELFAQLVEAQRDQALARQEASRALGALRKQLSPLYQALRAVFGELDAAHVEESASAPSTRVAAVWSSWKSKLAEGPGKIIDALLVHGDMNTQQIAIATGYHRTSIPKMIYQLNKAGLLNKSGGRFSLKAL